jgi:hypothetical protein
MNDGYLEAIIREIGKEKSEERHIGYRGTLVPSGSKVLASLNEGRLLLLDNGLFEIIPKLLNWNETKSSNFIPFREITKTTVVSFTASTSTLKILKQDISLAGATIGTKTIEGVGKNDLVRDFHAKLVKAMNEGLKPAGTTASASEQISSLKELLDSGVLTQAEFDTAKTKLLGSL